MGAVDGRRIQVRRRVGRCRHLSAKREEVVEVEVRVLVARQQQQAGLAGHVLLGAGHVVDLEVGRAVDEHVAEARRELDVGERRGLDVNRAAAFGDRREHVHELVLLVEHQHRARLVVVGDGHGVDGPARIPHGKDDERLVVVVERRLDGGKDPSALVRLEAEVIVGALARCSRRWAGRSRAPARPSASPRIGAARNRPCRWSGWSTSRRRRRQESRQSRRCRRWRCQSRWR